MPAALEAESTLTNRYQTTVPETVRRALGLGKRDKIRYSIHPGFESNSFSSTICSSGISDPAG